MSLPPSFGVDDDPGLGPEDFHALYQRYQPYVYGHLFRKGLSPDEAYELTQEVFVQAYEGLASLRKREAFVSWVYRIADNLFKKYLTKKSRSIHLHPPGDGELNPEHSLLSEDVGALDDILDREKADLLRDAIDELPERRKECLRLSIIDELSYKEIGQRLGISEKTVGVHIHRATKYLQARLKNYRNGGGSDS